MHFPLFVLEAYEVPSSPLTAGTPSLGDSSSEIDELFLPSPPDGNRPLIQSMLSAQMGKSEYCSHLRSWENHSNDRGI